MRAQNMKPKSSRAGGLAKDFKRANWVSSILRMYTRNNTITTRKGQKMKPEGIKVSTQILIQIQSREKEMRKSTTKELVKAMPAMTLHQRGKSNPPDSSMNRFKNTTACGSRTQYAENRS